jgi:hypothetical protein
MGDNGHSSVFAGESRLSQMLDVFVCIHCFVAFSFASVMLFYPDAFGLFIKGGVDEIPEIAKDVIKWASPFVFGFSFLAAASLSFTPRDRVKVAQIYTASFVLATAVGISVQMSGRWNSYHPINIALFASLAVVYGFFLLFEQGRAFYRTETVGRE